MFTKTLQSDTFRAIQLASSISLIQSAYLAGGTALSLQLGHRVSVDLDFFTLEKFDEMMASVQMKQIPQFVEDRKAWATILGRIGETKLSLFYYPYKLISPTVNFEGIKLAGKPDIAAMKIQAIGDRGVTRDFIDVFFLAKEYSLDEMLKFYDQKFGGLSERIYHLLKSLDYFTEAESEKKMPRMLVPVDWEKVKSFFRSEVKRLWQDFLRTPLQG